MALKFALPYYIVRSADGLVDRTMVSFSARNIDSLSKALELLNIAVHVLLPEWPSHMMEELPESSFWA
jgi:hypothetical protein